MRPLGWADHLCGTALWDKSQKTTKSLNLLAHPTRFERVTFAFGGLPHWHYAANFGIGLSTNRKNRVLRVPDRSARSSNGRWFHPLLYALPFDLLKQGLVA